MAFRRLSQKAWFGRTVLTLNASVSVPFFVITDDTWWEVAGFARVPCRRGNLKYDRSMSGLFDLLASQIGGSTLDQLGSQIGADRSATEKAVTAAIPALLGGLAKNANRSPEGASALAAALDRDHDGSILDNLGGLLGGLTGGSNNQASGGGLGSLIGAAGALLGGGRQASKSLDGAGILGHVLGQRQSTVEAGVAKASGLDAKKVAALLPLLAPIVMGAVGKMKRQNNMNASDLAGMLAGETRQIEERSGGLAGGLMDLLDADDDGQVVDDLMKLGGSGLLGKLLGGNK